MSSSHHSVHGYDDAWADLAEHPVVAACGVAMRHEGLTAARASDALRILDQVPVGEVEKALMAARASGITLANLDVWARLMRELADADRAVARRRSWFREWTLTARLYVNALDGRERLAAWAAAARIGIDELRAMESREALTEETLMAQAALVWLSTDEPPGAN